MVESMTKSSGLYTLSMKGKSTFNTILNIETIDHRTPFPMLLNSMSKWLKNKSLQIQMVIVYPYADLGI